LAVFSSERRTEGNEITDRLNDERLHFAIDVEASLIEIEKKVSRANVATLLRAN
jgi:hypothetical protein